jgi:methylated-DNA-[protein]-cysteine S-methyltransferase
LRSNRAAVERALSYIALMIGTPNFTLFETAIGWCGIVWNEHGIAGVQLPERNREAMRARLLRRFSTAGEAPPAATVQQVIDDIAALLRGERRDLGHVKIATEGLSDLQRRVYDVARAIPVGSTLTYGEIAERLGDRSLARDVGQALGENPFPIIVPCHRVLAAGGKTGGFSAPGGAATKLRLLAIEGAQPGGPTLFDDLPYARTPRPRP